MARRLPTPEECAQQLLCALGIDTVPVNPSEICRQLAITLCYEPFDGLEGALITTSACTKILVAINAYGPRSRFTIAHELGHFHLHSNKTEFWCSTEDIAGGLVSSRGAEGEANRFASALLMPPNRVSRDFKVLSFSLASIQAIATKYGVSLTAAAIRFAKETADAGFLVMTRNRRIEYVVPTRNRLPFYIERRVKPPLEFDQLETAGRTPHIRTVNATEWGDDSGYAYELVEESFYMPLLNQVLTILTPTDESYEELLGTLF